MVEVLMAEVREEMGTNAVKHLRKKGYLTANLYGKKISPLDLKLKRTEFQRRFGKDIVPSTVIPLQVGAEVHNVILKQWQRELSKQQLIHLDFQEVSEEDKIRLEIPLQLVGEAPGYRAGGIIQQPLRTIEVETLAANVPAKIEVNINKLKLGEQITVAKLPKITGLTYLADSGKVVVGIVTASREEAAITAE